MLLSTAIVLTPDWTVLIQLGIFLSVLPILSTFVFGPLVRVRDLRRTATVGAVEEAKRLEAVAEEKSEEYRRQIEAARQEGAAVKEQLQQEGYTKAREIIDGTRQQVFARLDAAKAKMRYEADAARRLLEANTEEFARAIAERLLERSLSESPQRRQLQSDLSGRRTTS